MIFVLEFEYRDSVSHIDKTSTKVFENKSNDSKHKPSCDFTSRLIIFKFSEELDIFDYLKNSIAYSEYKQ